MPRNLSAGSDLAIHLGVLLLMIIVISQYNRYLAAIAFVVWLVLALFARERTKDRKRRFTEYCENVVSSGNEMMHYAMKSIPQAIMLINEDGRLEWFNELTAKFSNGEPAQGMSVNDFWEGILSDEVLAPNDNPFELKFGEYTAKIPHIVEDENGERIDDVKYFWIKYKQIAPKGDYPKLTVLFALEITVYEKLRIEYNQSRTALMYVQLDNYDEIMQGLNETEKSSLLLAVNEELDKWVISLSGLLQRVSDDLYIIVMERYALNKAIDNKFTILDKVRQIVSKNGIPATLSMGVAVADKWSDEQSMTELGKAARERLNAALARGGDQASVVLDGKIQYFGGHARAVEKHNRVRARVTANSIREHMEASDEIFIMGHIREDFDAFGAAVGVAVMALHIKKPVHVILSGSIDGIEKIVERFFRDRTSNYKDIFVKASNLPIPTSINPLLIIVDTHIPYLVAAPILLERIPRVIVIDHHRKSDNVIKNPILFYHEPSSSSASELVTELLMYFDEKVAMGKLAATALYSGIVVDTKSFVVQTGTRTFDAAAYLRRNGADPVVVRELFMSDYETMVALSKAMAHSEYYEGGLVVSTMPTLFSNIQAIAGQAADSFLNIENVRMSIVLFQMKDDKVGISARSGGTLNVQVIMEKFGGGGHQMVAGAQVQGTNIIDLKNRVVEVARKYIAENDKEEA